jgi:hypothetical protein
MPIALGLGLKLKFLSGKPPGPGTLPDATGQLVLNSAAKSGFNRWFWGY